MRRTAPLATRPESPSGAAAMSLHRLRRQAGFSIAEFLVASAIFLFVAVVAYTAFENSRASYGRGESAAEMQQRTRLTFELMLEELRLAGFDYNRDGVETPYPDHPDEQLEWVGAAALTMRANLDYTNLESGREPDLQTDPSDSDFGEVCCPVVTTGNDEIVTYALRSTDPSKNTDAIEFKVDLTAPRDAGWDPLDGTAVGEEVVEITNLDFSNENPPYTLYRFHLDENGQVQARPMAENVRSLSFVYEDSEGNDFYCTSREDDGSCATGNQVPFDTLGGADHLSGTDNARRDGRAQVRRVHVEIVGMTEDDDLRYVDQDDPVMPHRRKMVLDTIITPQNLGLRGRPDLDSEDAAVPTGVSLCGGQCDTVRVEWNTVSAAESYQVNLYVAGQADPFFSAVTPGIAVADSAPARAYAVYQRIDHSAIQLGTTLVATVQSRTGEDRVSDESAYASPVQLEDVARLEAPMTVEATGYDPEATGWPLVEDNLVDPVTDAGTPASALPNEIIVSWRPPEYALDVLDPTDPANTWTTREGGAAAALSCDAEDADTNGDGVFDAVRTRSRELASSVRYLVFRSSDPHFVPTNQDLVGEVIGEALIDGRVRFHDKTEHDYAGGVFQETQQAVVPCRTYYYRVRAVDACWSGGDPASTIDPHLSPFAPPLNPDPYADDSDDVGALSGTAIGPAIPGYAIPAAKPRRPENVLLHDLDTDLTDGDGIDALISFDAVKQDTYSELDPLGNPVPLPKDIAVAGYRVYSHPSDPNFSLADALNGTNGVQLEKEIWLWDDHAQRIAHDDENGDGVVSPVEDESEPNPLDLASPASGLRIDLSNDSPRFYRVTAVQCLDEYTVPSPSNADTFDYSQLSEAVQFPCAFGGGESSMIYVDSSDYDNSVTATAYPELADVAMVRAWMILIDPDTGERARSANPVSPDAFGVAFFDAAHIDELTRNFGSGHYFLHVEFEDENGCFKMSEGTEIDLGLGSCCLDYPSVRPHVQIAPLRVEQPLDEICGTLRLQIWQISLQSSKNSGRQKRFNDVWWDDGVNEPRLLWTGSHTRVVIDLLQDPVVLEPGATGGRLLMEFDRDPSGDDLLVTYDYRIAGSPGTCTFETLGL